MVQFKIDNLSIGYDKNIIAEGISFYINEGDYLCIIGENGAGKSTLLKTLLNLQKPLAGALTLEGITNKDIGYLPQQKDIQKDFPASVYEVVLSGCLNKSGFRPFYNQKEKILALKSMEKLGILNLSKSCYRELSGGQQQRVLLARALCAVKKIIFLDEPSAGLDPDAMNEMYSIIKKLNHEDGITVVMISHDLNSVLKYASHILKIDHSEIFYGTLENYLQNHDKNGGI